MAAHECRDPIAIAQTHAGEADFERMSPRALELRNQLAQRTAGQPIAVRMSEHDGRARRARGCDHDFQRGPFDRHVSGLVAREPAVEGLLRIAGVARRDERTRDVRARGHAVTGESCGSDIVAGQMSAAREPGADLDDAGAASRADIREQGGQRRSLDPERDDVDRLAAPACRKLHAGHECHAVSGAGLTRFVVTGERVVVGERQQTYAARCRARDELARGEYAVGMRAVRMQVDQGRHEPAMIKHSMSCPLPNGAELARVDTLLLDLDGTLLDLAYDTHVWRECVPRAYARVSGLTPDEAWNDLHRRLRAREHTLEWYSIEFWSRELGVDIAELHREAAERICWLPGALEFLDRARARGKRLVLLTNAHPVTLAIKDDAAQIRARFDAAHSSAQFGAPKEDERFWREVQLVERFDPDRSLFIDDSAAVLQGARAAGVRHVIGVRRPDSTGHLREHPDFPSIDTIADLLRHEAFA